MAHQYHAFLIFKIEIVPWLICINLLECAKLIREWKPGLHKYIKTNESTLYETFQLFEVEFFIVQDAF